MDILASILGAIINFIYGLINNYGLTIIIFTVFIKVLLLPLNILVHKNSIKMVKIKPELEELKLKYQDDKDSLMEEKLKIFKKEKYKPILGIIPMLIQIFILMGLTTVLKNQAQYITDLKSTNFLGFDLLAVPSLTNLDINTTSLIIVAVTTYMLCFFQNKANVLQIEESKASQMLTSTISLTITIYFALFVPVGVGFYWSLGNIFAIFQLYLLNYIFDPKKYIDYERLEKVKNVLRERKKTEQENIQKEKEDYKRFFKNGSKQLVFYSEGNGYYKYFEPIITYILENSDIVIHYITNDANDNIFKMSNKKIIGYYVGINKLIPMFMKMDADIVVMTTPDLQKYYLKRSMVRKDVEYIHTGHGMTSINLDYREGAVDHFDTIFVPTKQQYDEIRAIEKLRGTQKKNLIKTGYCLLDKMIEDYEKLNCLENEKKVILIAPSWQEDNIMDSCLDEILSNCLNKGLKIIVRPHPQYIKRSPVKMKEILEKYKDKVGQDFEFQLDFSETDTVYKSDLLITDWSSIGYEYVFTTTKPCLFINTKIKINNPSYDEIDVEPTNVILRNVIGKSIEKNEVKNIFPIIQELIENKEKYMTNNVKVRSEYLYNVGNVAQVEGEYIINKIKEKEREVE